MSDVAITGNTYPVKDELKKLGARWDAANKVWLVPQDQADKAKEIVASAPAKSSKPFRHTKCVVCGVAGGRYTPIYRSGECRDCYEERKMGY